MELMATKTIISLSIILAFNFDTFQAFPASSNSPLSITNTSPIPKDTSNNQTDDSASAFNDLYKDVQCEQCNISYCYYNGGCCISGSTRFCLCLTGYVGEFCEWNEPEESKYINMKLTLVTSLATLFIILLTLILLVFVIFYVIKKSKNGHGEQQYKNLDKELLYVQGELEKLAGNDKYCGKKRLSKMIEATARAALITYPDIVATLDEGLERKNSVITRRQSEPNVLSTIKQDPYKVERSTAVMFYNKPGRVQMTKLKKCLSH